MYIYCSMTYNWSSILMTTLTQRWPGIAKFEQTLNHTLRNVV